MTNVKKPAEQNGFLYYCYILLSREEALARKARGSQGQ